MTHAKETTDLLLANCSRTYILDMKLKEIDCCFQQYSFHFRLVRWGNILVCRKIQPSEMSVPVIRRYLRTDKGQNWWGGGGVKPSPPQRIISGLRETFIKRYVVERTNKADIRPEEHSEKAESCRENLWNKM